MVLNSKRSRKFACFVLSFGLAVGLHGNRSQADSLDDLATSLDSYLNQMIDQGLVNTELSSQSKIAKTIDFTSLITLTNMQLLQQTNAELAQANTHLTGMSGSLGQTVQHLSSIDSRLNQTNNILTNVQTGLDNLNANQSSNNNALINAIHGLQGQDPVSSTRYTFGNIITELKNVAQHTQALTSESEQDINDSYNNVISNTTPADDVQHDEVNPDTVQPKSASDSQAQEAHGRLNANANSGSASQVHGLINSAFKPTYSVPAEYQYSNYLDWACPGLSMDYFENVMGGAVQFNDLHICLGSPDDVHHVVAFMKALILLSASLAGIRIVTS